MDSFCFLVIGLYNVSAQAKQATDAPAFRQAQPCDQTIAWITALAPAGQFLDEM